MTQTVLRARPELVAETVRDAKIMAEALDGVWTQLDRIVRSAGARSVLRTSRRDPRPGLCALAM